MAATSRGRDRRGSAGLALIALVGGIALLLVARGSSPKATAASSSATTSTLPSTTEVSGFTPQIEADFVDRCIAGGADRAVCQCTIAGMRDAMTFERFQAIDRQLQTDSSFQLPDDVAAIITNCNTAASGTPTSTGPP